MLETLISSKTRLKLLLKLFLNSSNRGYLRGLEDEFGENSNAVRLELNRLEEAGMITSEYEGNKKMFTANKKHPLFFDIHKILIKHIGIDTIVDKIITQIGDVEEVYLSGRLAKGLDAPTIDLEIVGNPNIAYLTELIARSEDMMKRKVCYTILSKEESSSHADPGGRFLIWSRK